MYKIIWNRDSFKRFESRLSKEFDCIVTTDPNEVPHDKVGIIVSEDNVEQIQKILEMMALEKRTIVLETTQGWVQLDALEMMYLESFGDEIYMHTTHESQRIKQPLYQLEEMLKPYAFVRIGKSFIVNMNKIRYIRTGFNAKLDLELTDGTHLEVSRSFVNTFKNALGIRNKEE
jgi:DNA-binding LytR/AlgR family response regulator